MLDYDTPGWRVHLPVFEGPLDLLLYLIKKSEVDIYDVELESITNQYLAYLDQMQEMNLEVAGEFLVVAAHLIYLKSRTLLPEDQQPPEEEEEESDPRMDLIRQLVEYKKFKEASEDLGRMEDAASKLFPRADVPKRLKVTQSKSLGKVGVVDLIEAFQKILDRTRDPSGEREIVEEQFTVGQKIEYVTQRLTSEKRVMFSDLFVRMESRHEIVVTFLAVLELIRLKKLRFEQKSSFDDIAIRLASEDEDVDEEITFNKDEISEEFLDESS